jgi:hypothetical protein
MYYNQCCNNKDTNEPKDYFRRLNENTVWELEFLKSSMGDKRTTEVLTEAIHHLYKLESQKHQKKTAFNIMENDLIKLFNIEQRYLANIKTLILKI